MIVSMVCFACNDAFIKSLGGCPPPVFQTLSVSGAVAVIFLGILVVLSAS